MMKLFSLDPFTKVLQVSGRHKYKAICRNITLEFEFYWFSIRDIATITSNINNKILQLKEYIVLFVNIFLNREIGKFR